MVYNKNYYQTGGEGDYGKELAYDLRQIYANNIVGEHLIDIAMARKKDKYSEYFKCLEDLYVVVRHKFTHKEESIAKYERLIKRAIEVSNKYPSEWLGTSNESYGCMVIRKALNEVEMFSYNQDKDSANVFF